MWCERQKKRVEWNHETWVETIIFPIREHNPAPAKVDPGLLGFGQNREHVGMPLSELVNPVRDVSETLSIHDDVVEPFLKRREQNNTSKKRAD